MPSGKIKIKHKDHILSQEFFKAFKKEYPEIHIDWDELVEIVRESNEEIANIVSTEQNGFKLPEGHGYLVVTSFKSNQKSIDIANSHKYGKLIYHLNLNTFGKRSAIRWFNNNSFYYYPKIYKFQSCRTFARKVAHSTKSGTVFLHWLARDFIKFDKISKLKLKRNKTKWE